MHRDTPTYHPPSLGLQSAAPLEVNPLNTGYCGERSISSSSLGWMRLRVEYFCLFHRHIRVVTDVNS